MSNNTRYDSEADPTPQSLSRQLAAEEPPVIGGDTTPSATSPTRAVHAPEDDNWQRYLGGAMLFAALLLTLAAMLIVFLGDDEPDNSSEETNRSTSVPQIVNDEPSLVPDTPQPEDDTPGLLTTNPLPTAAADEQAAALLTPLPGLVNPGAAISRDTDPITVRVSSQERGFVAYQVQQGDTLNTIKDRFNLSDVCTLVWSNDRSKVNPLRPGAEIVVPPVDGVFAKIREPITVSQLASATQADVFAIIDSPYNPALLGATADTTLVDGLQIMVPDGNGGDCNVWEAPVAGGDGENESGGPASYSLWGCNADITTTGFPVQNPVSGRYEFWQGFTPAHNGIDLAADIGTPVVAAGSGTVIYAGWNDYGYGRVVVIAHGSNFTLYADMNSIDVGCGQSVSQGQRIGSVGSSGRSSGPHLHFEIRDAGFNAINPIYTISV